MSPYLLTDVSSLRRGTCPEDFVGPSLLVVPAKAGTQGEGVVHSR